MRRLKTFFLTLLLALVASSAFATTWEDGKVIKIGEPVTEVQAGQWYALYSMLGGWIYDANGGANGSRAYWLTDESNLTSGMVANDVKDYLLQLESSKTEGAYYIQYANDKYVYMYSTSNSYAWSWSNGTTETIVKVEGTDDVFSIHETGANYCFYTWNNGQYACTSWQNGTVASNWQANYKYQFYAVEIVDPSEVDDPGTVDPGTVGQPEPGEWGNTTIEVASDCVTDVVAGQWYLVRNPSQYKSTTSADGGYIYPQPYEGFDYNRLAVSDGLEVAQSGMAAADVEEYLVRFILNETDTLPDNYPAYIVQFGTGEYWYLNRKKSSQYVRAYSEEQIEEKGSNNSSWWIYHPINDPSGPEFAISYPTENVDSCTHLSSQGSGGMCITAGYGLKKTSQNQYNYYLYPVTFVEGDDTGTTEPGTVEPGNIDPIDLSGVTATKSDEFSLEFDEDQWYMVYTKGSSSTYVPAYWHKYTNSRGTSRLYTETATTVESKHNGLKDVPAEDISEYLVRFIPTNVESLYFVQLGTGDYLNMEDEKNGTVYLTTDISSATPVFAYSVTWGDDVDPDDVKDPDNEFYVAFNVPQLNGEENSYRIAAYGSDQYVYLWNTGKASYDSNMSNHFWIYPVELTEILGEELQPGDEVEVDGATYEILSENMVENFDFSDGFTSWTGARDFTTEITGDRFELVEGGALHGDNYLVGTFLGDAANNGALGKVWEIEPYMTYYFSYWVKAYENACDTTDGKWLKTSLTDIPGIEKVILEEEKKDISSEWKKVEVVFTNTDGYAYLQIDFRWLNSQYGLDDFQLYELVQTSETVHEEEAEFDHWSIAGNTGGSFQYNTWSNEDDPSGMTQPFIEYWVGTGNQLSDATISHETLTDLAPGYYIISIDARAFNENSQTKVGQGIVLSANGTSVDLSLGTHDVFNGVSAEVYGTYEVPCMVGSDGTLDIAFTLTGANCDWLAFKNLKVTFMGTEYELPAVEDIAAVEGDMNTKASEAQEAAIAAYTEEQSTETAIALYQALAEAKLSANFYAEIAETIADLDEAGQAYFAATEEGAAYEAKTLEYTDMTEVYVASMKQQTTIGKDLTFVVESTEWIGQTGTYGTAVERYGDEVEVDGDEPVKVLYQHIEGLVPGSWYKVEFLGVANNAWVGAAVGDGIAQVFANDVAEGVTVYDQTGCTITDYPHTLTCEVGEDGVLEYGLQNIATGGNWYVAQAISLTIADEVLTDTESDYHIGDIVEIDGVEYEVQSENMVENHSFELGFTGWTSANDFTSEITSAKFDWVNDGTAQDGKRHLVGTTNSSSSSDGSLGTAWAIEPGKTYMMSYWIKNLDGTEETEYLKTSLTNNPGDETFELGYPETVDSDWQKVEYVFDNDSYAYVQVKFRWLENHWAFDNFQIYEILAPEDVVIEPGDVVHECVAEVDHWAIEGNTNGDFHYNDWSVEADASGMVVPFLEYWVWSGEGNLSAATISHETLTDLPAGSYEVSLDVRIFSEAGNEIGEGTTLAANDASVDVVAAGTADVYGTETEVYGTYVLTATVDEDGTLDISLDIPEGVTYNWIALKNLSVTYLGEVEEPETLEPGDVAHECVAEVDHWAIEGNTNGDFHYNDWSVEADASGMVVPFLEYWVWSGEGNLSAATISHETLTDLPAGSYEVSLDVRIFSEAGNEIGEGTTLAANDASVDVVAAGTADVYGTETEVYGTYVLTATVDEDGTLDISLDIPEGVTYNWIALKNLSVTYLGEEEEPALAEGEYLIVNAEGNYLGGGLTWGTQASIIGKPQFIGFELQEDGTYHLDSHQYNSADSHYLGSNLYFDSTPVDWTIEEVDGGYTIHGTVDDGTGYLTSNGFQTVPTVEADPYVWTLLTIEDVIAGMDEATADAPVDVTALIAAPEMKRNSNTSYYPTWTVTGYDGTGTPSNYAFGSGSAVANCSESYHSTNGFNFSQEITLPLAGYYTLSAKGFYRDDESTTLLLPVLYAGEETSTFPELDTSANTMAEAYAEFLEGLHPIDAITIEAAEDGETVTIGFKGEDTSLWNIMGELELLYLGAEAPVDNSYHFVNTEWVPSDNNRASANQITYNDDNTITINASGANNIAVGNSEGMAAYSGITTSNYIVTNAQQWFVVVASNVATENATDSYLWWMNGCNYGTQEVANIVKVLDDGQVLVAWDIPTTAIGDNMTNDENYLDGWTCFGLTSTTGTSTISDINFYTWDDLAVKYPELADGDAIGGVQTGISNVAEDVEIEGIYDLSGRKVSKTVKGGIYIIDGKKVLVK